MKKYICLSSAVLSMAISSTLSASIIVDFTTAGPTNAQLTNTSTFTFTTQDPTGTGVSFVITASALNVGTGQGTGDITQLNSGLGATTENGGTFLNVINGVSEELVFTISNVVGLASTDSLVITNLLSQNSSGDSATQAGGFGGTFGNAASDSITLTSDSGSTSVVNQTDNDIGSILLATDNNTAVTGNTFAHAAGGLAFASSFSLAQTDLTDNDAFVIQGFEFDVIVPEPSTSLLMGLGVLTALLGRRKRA